MSTRSTVAVVTRPVMRQSIHTYYLPATNVKGSRVKASAEAGSVTLSWDDSLNTDENHMRAARTLADKYEWGGNWVGGCMPDNKGYVWIDIS